MADSGWPGARKGRGRLKLAPGEARAAERRPLRDGAVPRLAPGRDGGRPKLAPGEGRTV